MEKISLFDVARYKRMRERNMDYSRALARTNLAVRCWLGRVGDGYRDDSISHPRHRILAWMLTNHILQAFYRRIGVDVLPFSCGGMYGYGLSVGINKKSCNRGDIGETAWIACGSVRVDPKVGDERPYHLTDIILSGEDPLWAIDKAATAAIGSRWLDKCPAHDCWHYKDADIYLVINQIITMLLAMGYVRDAILGTFVDCSEYGIHEGPPRHPLRVSGVFSRPQFTMDYFEMGPVYKNSEVRFWIHRRNGDLWFGNENKAIPFADWCGGAVDRGLSWLCSRIERI